MKYGKLNLGQIEAIVNKLGGETAAKEFLRDEIAVIMKVNTIITSKITIEVDEALTVEKLVESVRPTSYKSHNGGPDASFTSTNFPKQMYGKKSEKEIALFSFKGIRGYHEIITEMHKMSYEPATVWELVGLAIKKPDIYKKIPIVALGSVLRMSNYLSPVMYTVLWDFSSTEGNLTLLPASVMSWDKSLFAGVRK